ncbi:hypothetical protein GAYE_SCF22MG4211 [Galdieria yellowstonensis]|uniref:Malonyl-CoA decarboxylase C-terminal domain-containing protein n=1 Tax=Galdieria yellowstonensis TaxID=3028027 RepID=A0AAV9IFX3_9RHOD|nr:hypothetical protein GAYE_SCF22MG4211 [Galdieria yellowstonensis]
MSRGGRWLWNRSTTFGFGILSKLFKAEFSQDSGSTMKKKSVTISQKYMEGHHSPSPLDAAKTYMECIGALTEWPPSDLPTRNNKNRNISSTSNVTSVDVEEERKKQSLLDKRSTLHNMLWEVLKKPPAPQKMKLFSVRHITQSLIQSLANSFVDIFPLLDMSRKARMISMLMVDFPTNSSILSKLYPSSSRPSCTMKPNISSQDWDDEEDSGNVRELAVFYPGVEKYYGWFFYWNFFSLLLNHPKGFQVLCDVRYLLSVMYTPEQVKQLEHYFVVDRPFQTTTESISWLIKYNHRVLAPCFGQSFLGIHEMNANYASYIAAYSRALKRLYGTEEEEANRRIQQQRLRRIFVLTQVALPKFPLSFCEVVFLPQPATSLHQIEEFSTHNDADLSASCPTVIEHIRSFVLPRMNFSRVLLNRVMRERIPQITTQTQIIYSLCRLGDFVDWLWRYFILKIGTREFPVDMPKDVYSRVANILSILYGGDLKRQVYKTTFTPDDYQQLEQEKDLLLSLCALYICYVKRLKGLPYDTLATFHLGNGAELSDICWMADNSPMAMTKNLCLMALFSYRLEYQEENVIIFSTQGKIGVSDKIKSLLDRLPRI